MNAYFDNNSATRIDDKVFEAMLPFLRAEYGNPQSMNTPGMFAKDAIESARAKVAAFIGAKPNEIIFTSCGSEANNLAIKGIAEANAQKGKHIIVSAIEHFSVLNAAKRLSQQGFEVTLLPVDGMGLVDPSVLKKALRSDTVLVSVQMANQEIGTIQPARELAGIAQGSGILFHTDAIAAAATMPIDVVSLGVNALSISATMFHGPKGAAALYVKKGTRMIPQIDGGVQEDGKRAGTENVPAIIGMGTACQIAKENLASASANMAVLRDRLINELPKLVKYVYLNGHPTKRLANNVDFSVEFIEGEGMMLFLDQKGISVTSGSACANKALKMSHVLSAIKVETALGQGSLLITLSKYTTAAEIDYFLKEFPPIVEKLRSMSPLYSHFQKTGKRMIAGPGTDYDHCDA
jgi:cysteine desulfurase